MMNKLRITKLVEALLVATAELSPGDYEIFEGRLLAAIEFNAKQVVGLAASRQADQERRQRQQGESDEQTAG